VSQFTLLASTKKGAKPDFHGAANPEEARRLYHYFVQKVRAGYMEERVKDGQFQAMMEVALVNDGPVSFVKDSLLFLALAGVCANRGEYIIGYSGVEEWCQDGVSGLL
jgi:hypothetical protein